ncbi:transglutaminase domain-containing protein [Mangrovimonas sp. TPBH4]|uniref:transglutaminase domain-containing protein n=1 Tax=Mangrovimonas sp. TPBH4 TaxID=1645914 RepID=UPI0006B633E0|nr:transglutaminase domain-containing protein [Mangrovimonas sp. TPBH4]
MKYLVVLISIFYINSSKAQLSDFVHIDFTKADNTAKLHQGADLKNLGLLAHQLTANLSTDVEKFRAIYFWVCHNINGDSNQHNKVDRKRKKMHGDSAAYSMWNEEYKKIAFKKLLKHKKTMCTGYAYLIKELCFLANIDCKIIDGYGRTVNSNVEELEMTNHSWNAVNLNGKWYLCDATWSSGYTMGYTFVKDYNDGYFLTDPILFAKNHFPVDQQWVLTDTVSREDFTSSPMVYGETFQHQIQSVTPINLNTSIKKEEDLNFSFKSPKEISNNNISLVYFTSSQEQTLKIYDLKIENGYISFKTNFNHKGIYDVHLKIGKDIVATYTIEVTK